MNPVHEWFRQEADRLRLPLTDADLEAIVQTVMQLRADLASARTAGLSDVEPYAPPWTGK